ncbi:Rap1a/Tai family immunity protein [Croceibacterium salegens]|uniref:Rap1a/Tai family immunity protein n=1 Tax=Croceibacterium salegens TaxID=1737568 RepID=UPI0038B28688
MAVAQSTHTEPSFATAGDVLRTCRAESGSVNALICNGYIRGILRRDDLARWMNPTSAYVCEMPEGVTIGQILAVAVKYIDERPENWHFEGTSVALHGIKYAFCTAPSPQVELGD